MCCGTNKLRKVSHSVAGLMAAEVLSKHGVKVDVYDAMPSLGRKFLMAGKSGLNITHSESFEQFVSRYGNRKEEIRKWVSAFTPDDLRNWVHEFGFEAFVGTSRRVFPVGMKASPLLRAWINKLSEAGVNFHLRHKWDYGIRELVLVSAAEDSGLSNLKNLYIKDKSIDSEYRKKFIEDEITFTDASSGKKTAEYILKILKI